MEFWNRLGMAVTLSLLALFFISLVASGFGFNPEIYGWQLGEIGILALLISFGLMLSFGFSTSVVCGWAKTDGINDEVHLRRVSACLALIFFVAGVMFLGVVYGPDFLPRDGLTTIWADHEGKVFYTSWKIEPSDARPFERLWRNQRVAYIRKANGDEEVIIFGRNIFRPVVRLHYFSKGDNICREIDGHKPSCFKGGWFNIVTLDSPLAYLVRAYGEERYRRFSF